MATDHRLARTAGALLAALWVGLSPGTARAFICPDPDPVADFRAIAAASDSYVVVHGTLTAAGTPHEAGHLQTFPMEVRGHRLGRGGFETPVRLAFEQRHDCGAALSCPVAAAEGVALIFLRREGDMLVLEPGLCSQHAHFGIDRAALEGVVACHTQGACGD